MVDKVQVKIYRNTSDQFHVPVYQTPGDAGADVYCIEEIVLNPGTPQLVRTGIFMDIPEGYECQVRPRSGMALKDAVTVLNSPGTIDSSYKGECNVILINHGSFTVRYPKGARIAQFVFSRYSSADFTEVDSLEEFAQSDRGDGGFGHTG